MTDTSSPKTHSCGSEDLGHEDEIDVVNDAASSHEKSGMSYFLNHKLL